MPSRSASTDATALPKKLLDGHTCATRVALVLDAPRIPVGQRDASGDQAVQAPALLCLAIGTAPGSDMGSRFRSHSATASSQPGEKALTASPGRPERRN